MMGPLRITPGHSIVSTFTKGLQLLLSLVFKPSSGLDIKVAR